MRNDGQDVNIYWKSHGQNITSFSCGGTEVSQRGTSWRKSRRKLVISTHAFEMQYFFEHTPRLMRKDTHENRDICQVCLGGRPRRGEGQLERAETLERDTGTTTTHTRQDAHTHTLTLTHTRRLLRIGEMETTLELEDMSVVS